MTTQCHVRTQFSQLFYYSFDVVSQCYARMQNDVSTKGTHFNVLSRTCGFCVDTCCYFIWDSTAIELSFSISIKFLFWLSMYPNILISKASLVFEQLICQLLIRNPMLQFIPYLCFLLTLHHTRNEHTTVFLL